GVGEERAGNLVNERGLAGGVGAGDGVGLASRDIEVYAVGDLERAERFAQLLQPQDRFAHRRLQRSTATAIPRRMVTSNRPRAILHAFQRATASLAVRRNSDRHCRQRSAPAAKPCLASTAHAASTCGGGTF